MYNRWKTQMYILAEEWNHILGYFENMHWTCSHCYIVLWNLFNMHAPFMCTTSAVLCNPCIPTNRTRSPASICAMYTKKANFFRTFSHSLDFREEKNTPWNDGCCSTKTYILFKLRTRLKYLYTVLNRVKTYAIDTQKKQSSLCWKLYFCIIENLYILIWGWGGG